MRADGRILEAAVCGLLVLLVATPQRAAAETWAGANIERTAQVIDTNVTIDLDAAPATTVTLNNCVFRSQLSVIGGSNGSSAIANFTAVETRFQAFSLIIRPSAASVSLTLVNVSVTSTLVIAGGSPGVVAVLAPSFVTVASELSLAECDVRAGAVVVLSGGGIRLGSRVTNVSVNGAGAFVGLRDATAADGGFTPALVFDNVNVSGGAAIGAESARFVGTNTRSLVVANARVYGEGQLRVVDSLCHGQAPARGFIGYCVSVVDTQIDSGSVEFLRNDVSLTCDATSYVNALYFSSVNAQHANITVRGNRFQMNGTAKNTVYGVGWASGSTLDRCRITIEANDFKGFRGTAASTTNPPRPVYAVGILVPVFRSVLRLNVQTTQAWVAVNYQTSLNNVIEVGAGRIPGYGFAGAADYDTSNPTTLRCAPPLCRGCRRRSRLGRWFCLRAPRSLRARTRSRCTRRNSRTWKCDVPPWWCAVGAAGRCRTSLMWGRRTTDARLEACLPKDGSFSRTLWSRHHKTCPRSHSSPQNS